MFLPSANVEYTSLILVPMTFFNQLLRVLAIILYMQSNILIGIKSPSVIKSLIFGTKVVKDEIHPHPNLQCLSRYFTNYIMSSCIISQCFIMNRNMNPSGPGAFSFPHAHMAHLISLLVKGISSCDLAFKLSVVSLLLISFGLDDHFCRNFF